MKNRELIVALLLAALGYAMFLTLFPKLDSSRIWGQRFTRSELVSAAHRVAMTYGIDTSGWSSHVGIHHSHDLDQYLSETPDARAELGLSSVQTLVVLRHPDGEQMMRVRFTPDGQPTAILLPEGRAAPKSESEASRSAAEAALARLVPSSGEYRLVSATDEGATHRFTWERTTPELPEVTLTSEVVMDGDQLREIWRGARLNSEYVRRISAPSWREPASVIFVMLFILISIAWAISRAVRRQMPPLKSIIVLFVACFLLPMLALMFSPPLDLDDFSGNASPSLWPWILGSFVLAVLIATALIAGHSAARQFHPNAAQTFDSFLRGRFGRRRKSISTAIAWGVLLGGLLAAIPYAVSGLPVFSWFRSSHGPIDALISPAGVLFDELIGPLLKAFLVFGFAAPVILTSIRSRAAAWILLLALGAGVFLQSDQQALAGPIVASLLTVALYAFIWKKGGLLAVVAATFAVTALTVSATLLVQPSPALNRSGVLMLVLLGVAGLTALVLSRTGKEDEFAEGAFVADVTPASRAERERIRAEFELARQAQEKMLPARLPEIPGFAASAVCKPAKQVGGDLYDFISLPRGQIGIAVADVSGKGVPAALFMTMTKGLLLAASEDRDDPRAILSDVNAGLYSLATRNVFVTMFFGVLDPASRRLRFVRAGHNPTLWRRAAQRETRSLSPGGMALGMASPRLFDRTLKVEEMTFEAGDALFIYSDGVTEAMNGSFEEYGDERFQAVVGKTDDLDASGAREKIVQDVARFVGKAPAYDDLTLVVIRALAEGFELNQRSA